MGREGHIDEAAMTANNGPLIWLAGAHILGFWVLVYYVVRLRKRLRCLGYCYISIGDWGINKANEAKEYYIDLHGAHVTPFILLRADQEFENMLTRHRQMFAKVGLSPPGQRELNYPIEGL